MDIYGDYEKTLQAVADSLQEKIHTYCNTHLEATGEKLYEHLSWRIKTPESMLDKCRREGYPIEPRSALKLVHDAIGIRIVCLFIDDIHKNIEEIKKLPGIRVYREKDYISAAKPNGYRSYHLILELEDETPDIDGNSPGTYFAEVQLRTIAMDTWAALEHELKYKKDIRHPELISEELKRCADELAACDVSLQTLRELIRN
ncbi:MAG: GTP pyrophosphokinase family protein [Lachnospiraceae bacterium]|nr:GTP pyrophosphokinase family protein [Lachnospiraceae bacterium]